MHGDKQTDRHAHHNTPLPYWRWNGVTTALALDTEDLSGTNHLVVMKKLTGEQNTQS